MARSEAYDWTPTRDDVIKAALRICGVLDPQETPSAEDVSTAAQALDMMLKSWNNTIVGLQLWTLREATVFCQTDKYQYTLGTSDAPSAWSYTTVAAQSTTNPGNTIVIPAGVGTAGDYIGIQQGRDSNWTTINTLSSSGTVHLTTSISSTATVSQNVWVFTNLMERPVDIVHARINVQSNNYDIELRQMGRDEYYDRHDKERAGEPRRYYFDKQLDNPVFVTDWTPDNAGDLIKIVYRRPYMNNSAGTDEIDAPHEVHRAIKWGLANEIGLEYGVPPGTMSEIQKRAAEALLQVRAIYGDRPRTSLPSTLV